MNPPNRYDDEGEGFSPEQDEADTRYACTWNCELLEDREHNEHFEREDDDKEPGDYEADGPDEEFGMDPD